MLTYIHAYMHTYIHNVALVQGLAALPGGAADASADDAAAKDAGMRCMHIFYLAHMHTHTHTHHLEYKCIHAYKRKKPM